MGARVAGACVVSAIVTGGAGFIGSHVVDLLAARGERVLVIDDLRNHASAFTFATTTLPAYVDDWPRRVDFWQLPVHAAEPDIRPDVIYHLAGPVGPVGVLPEAGNIARDIVRDSDTVRRWALASGAILVDVSTSEVYGTAGHSNGEGDPCVFGAESSARSEYATAKFAAERMLLNTPGLDVRIVRPFNVAGPRQRVDGGFVLPRFIGQALAGEPLTVYRPGTQRRAFTHVLDIAEGILLAAMRGTPGRVYNLGNPANECDILTLAREVLEVTGSASPIEVVDPVDLWGPAFREAPDKVPDAGRGALELGWYPKRDRMRTIRDALGQVAVPA